MALLHQTPQWLLFTGIIICAARFSAVSPHGVPAVIVFGDSTVDAGNNNQWKTPLRSNFKPYGRDFSGSQPTGRFCNGRIPPDFISEGFGLKPTVPAYLDPTYDISDFATGVTFASAGTGYDNATSDVLNVIPLWREVEYYKEYQARLRAHLGRRKANEVLRNAAYLVSIGTNDFLENYYTIPRRMFEYTIDEYQDFLIGIATRFLRELHGLGVRRVSLTGLPPMGCLPLERAANIFGDNECNEKLNRIALQFNGKLKDMSEKLNRELRGFRLFFTEDLYEFFFNIVKKPASYGFDVEGVACCSTGTFEMSYLCSDLNPMTCKDANKFIFWDAFHPSERINQIVSNHILPMLKTKFFS